MKRYDLCDSICTVDCGHCKGKGRPSDELRTAAATLRERATGGAASSNDAPWRAVREPKRNGDGNVTCLVTTRNESVFEDEHCALPDADYIATVHPGVGLALADWLDVVAERHKLDGTEELVLHLDTECSVCDDGGHEVVVCAGCYPTWDGMDGRSIYPCAEVKAALPLARLINGGAS